MRIAIHLIAVSLLILAGFQATAEERIGPGGKEGRAPAGRIEVRPESTVNAGRIRLGEIADLDGFSAARKKKLSGLVLAKAPKPGKSRTLSRRFLEKTLGAHANGARLRIPPQVEVKREAKILSAAELLERFEEAVIRASGLPAERVAVQSLNREEDLLIPVESGGISIDFPAGTEFYGRTTGRVSVSADGREQHHFYLTGEIEITEDVLKAARDLERGEALTEADWIVEPMTFTRAARNHYTSPDEIAGKVARQTIRRGAVLSSRNLEEPVLVERNALVRIVAEWPGLRAETQGVAQQSGRRGEVIKVLNTGSGKAVYGVVRSADEVHVRM